MKTASINYLPTTIATPVQSLYPTTITTTIMKKLANVSPFLLLLVPVFIMMLLTFTTSTVNTQNEEMAGKPTTGIRGMVKVNTIFFK